MTTLLKTLAILLVLAAATLGLLVVFDLLPVAALGEVGLKLLLGAAIVAVASAVIMLLLRSGR